MSALVVLVILGVIALVATPTLIVPLVSPRPGNLGVKGGRLSACPANTMNCVSSQQDTRASRALPPLTYTGTQAEAKAKLLATLAADGALVVDAAQPDYVYAEYRTPLMRFIDDVEFYIDDQAKVVHYRSASRIGMGDAGTNKARMTRFAQQWAGGASE